ncbi:MAG: cation:proton antiporter [Xanthomonadaceae bacterium]|nr:cation:proton antiporter [Xanthomonadaceae bacterium]
MQPSKHVGPHALGLVPDSEQTRLLAQFGIVFLLFTVGLNFSLPQIIAMRHHVFGLGTAQVVLTTAVVALVAWLSGLPFAAAFVVGAVFAQSSTTIISKQLNDQGEDQTRHGRLAVAMSVFQDVTAVPFVVIIPVLALGTAGAIALPLGMAALKAIGAFIVIFVLGRWVLKPLFHEVAARQSSELFTLTVLLVTLAAAAATEYLGLSMALGAFLAGMMLGDTEFRHQVESSIRPFRDVLLGLFFVTIGMLIDLSILPEIWFWALAGAVVLLVSKVILVTIIAVVANIDPRTALRTGIVMAVGGEFGFALLAIALGATVISPELAQVALYSVLFSMVVAPLLISNNGWLAGRAFSLPIASAEGAPRPGESLSQLSDHVIIGGYGRVGQNVGRAFEEEKVPYVAVDLDGARVRESHAAGLPVYYADSSEHSVIEALGVRKARLLVIAHDDVTAARRLLVYVRSIRPDLPIMVRTRDETHVDELLEMGATEVVPETIEASIMIASQALLLVGVPMNRVIRRMRTLQSNRYQLMREMFPTEHPIVGAADEMTVKERLHTVVLPDGAHAVGKRLGDLELECREVQSLIRDNVRQPHPGPDTVLQAGDGIVLFGGSKGLKKCEKRLISGV